MIKFFRTIHKKMIEEDIIRKYLLYAIGEILLVVIGILIALQVNTFIENKKIANKEQAILIRLHEDRELAKIHSQQFIEREKEDIQRLKIALGNQQVQTEILQQPNQDQFFYAAVWDLSFKVPIIITYADLQNAGNTGKIKNTRLRIRLSEMWLKVQIYDSIIDDRLSFHQTRIDNIIEYELNFLPMLAARKNLTDINTGHPKEYIQLLQKPNVRNQVIKLVNSKIN